MDVSSDESPRAPEGSDAPDDDPDPAGATDEKAKKAKKPKPPKAPKEPKEPKPPKEPKAPKAAKEPKEPKAPKAAKAAKPAKEPKQPKTGKRAKAGDDGEAPKGRRGRRAAKGAAPDEAATDTAGPDEDIGWTAATDALAGGTERTDEPADTDEIDRDGDGADGPLEPTTGSRKRLVGAVAIGPLLLIAALFLPTDRGRHGSAATAAPTSVPAATDDGTDETPVDEAPEDATPRFLVLIEQDLPPTTTVAPTTTTSTTVARRATTRTTAGEAAGGEAGEAGETPHEAPAPEPTPATAPPIVVNTIANEDTQLAVFLLTDGRRVEMAVPVRYFSLVPAGDPAQRTFDKEVAGHLLVRDRDGRYWGGDLDSEPALLYQLPSSKTIEPGPTTTAAAHAATTTTHAEAKASTTTTAAAADHAEATGTTTTATAEHAATEDHAATTAAETPVITIGTGQLEGDAAEGDATEAVTTTTEYVREPFPLVVQGAVSVEDERVVRLLAALPGVTSVLDLGRGAVIVSGDIDLQAVLDVPGVLSAQPTSAG